MGGRETVSGNKVVTVWKLPSSPSDENSQSFSQHRPGRQDATQKTRGQRDNDVPSGSVSRSQDTRSHRQCRGRSLTRGTGDVHARKNEDKKLA